MLDPHGRRIDYLRLSVTDRCGLRCQYCLPGAFGSPEPAGQAPLSDGETVRLVRVLMSGGIRRIRLTGGEPLTRPGLTGLIGGLASLPGLQDLSMTTNGQGLAKSARDLARAGLRRINVSLDALEPERYRFITRTGSIGPVLEGLEAALASGLAPVKVNVVVARGLNEDQIPAFVRMAMGRPFHVRFIELMPLGDAGFYSRERQVSLSRMMELCGPLRPLGSAEAPIAGGPASVYRAPGMRGSIGFIAPLSAPFCGSCNRLRLSSRGLLQACLDSDGGVDLAGPMREGESDDGLARLVERCVAGKNPGHTMCGAHPGGRPGRMCAIGG